MIRQRGEVTYPVHASATHPLPLQVAHEDGLAEHPLTSTLAQSTAVSCMDWINGKSRDVEWEG